MKIQGKIWGLLYLILFVTGCSKGEIPENDGELIRFAMQTDKTKAIPLTNDNLTDFGIYAYNTEQENWADVSTKVTANWIDNDVILRQKDSWLANITCYWPLDGRLLTFFAYAPYSNRYNGITVPSLQTGGVSVTGMPILNFEILPDVMAHTDLLVAEPHYDMTSKTANGYVNLKFKHTTTKIAFSIFCNNPGTSIQSLDITNSPYKGSMPIDGQNIWNIEADTRDFSLYLNGLIISTLPKEPTDLSDPVSYFLMFPFKADQSNPTTYIKVVYTMDGKDITKSVPILEDWEMGKSIRYTLNLGGSPADDIIIDKVTIVDWIYVGKIDQTLETNGEIYKLIFDANQGTSASVTEQSWENGSMPRITDNATPSRTGFTFDSWNTQQKGGGTKYLSTQRIKINSNITLYAQWR